MKRARSSPSDLGGGRGLNPYLYARLESLFGAVELSNEGEAMTLGDPALNRDTGRLEAGVVWPGEYYRVNCPFCDDTAKRLYVNHRYGTVHPDTGQLLNWLAICYNERCLDDWDNKRDFDDRLFGFVNRDVRLKEARAVVVKPGKVVDATLHEVPLPGVCPRVDALPPGHDAVRYLAGRGYDVAALGRRYGVAYCEDADPVFSYVRGRVVVPVVFGGATVGWQARYCGDIDFKARGVPKYYTMAHFPRRLVLYNWDRASRTRVLVLVEGVSDAWRVGREGVALLGNTVSSEQQALLSAWDRRGPGVVVLMLDGEAVDEADKAEARVRDAVDRARLVRVALPPGRDPGKFETPVLWGEVGRQCRSQGVRLSKYRRGT